MSASVKSVPNPFFSVNELASFAGSIVSRRRVKIPCAYPTTYGHNGQSTLPYVARFDLADPENFFDTESLRLSMDFTPVDEQKGTGVTATLIYPVRRDGTDDFFNDDAKATEYAATSKPVFASITGADALTYSANMARSDYAYTSGWQEQWTPVMDGGASALLARVRIGNAQGLLIEEHVQYNLWSNVASKLSPQSAKDGDITNLTADASNFVGGKARKLLMELKNISIFKQMRFFPLFLFRSALRVEIEFEQPKMAWYYPKLKLPDQQLNQLSASTIGAINSNIAYAAQSTPLLNGASTQIMKDLGLVSSVIRLHVHGHPLQIPYFDFACTSLHDNTSSSISWLHLEPLHVVATAGSTVVGARYSTSDFMSTYFQGANASNLVLLKMEYIHYPFKTHVVIGNNGTTLYPKFAWDYKLDNLEMLVDFVKPSSEIMVSYINQYNSPSGIPYSYLRSFYHSKITDSGSAFSPMQITLPFSVRSLKAILVVISDPLSAYTGNDSTIYNFPSLSAFQMRGLREAQLVVGAQQFPAYQLRFDQPDSTHVNQHLPELELISNLLFSSGSHSMKWEGLRKYGEDYSDFGHYDRAITREASLNATLAKYVVGRGAGPSDSATSPWYRDTRDFVLGFSTQKFDGDFASGIDTTASGSVTLNLHFDAHRVSRPRQIHIWGLADAVFTLQKDASLVRY